MVSCPGEGTINVYLTELLTNSTISEIKNEIRGDDDEENEYDDEIDYVRTLSKTGLSNIVLAKKSNELAPEYKDSIIVVFKNDTRAEEDDKTYEENEVYSVVRYYKKAVNGKIEEEHAFDFKTDSTVDDFYLFDDYALFLTEEGLNFKAIWFRNLGSKEWLVVDYKNIYNSFEQNKVVCEGCSIIDVGQGQGQWILACKERGSGGLFIKSYTPEINY